jgi:cytochrome b
MYNRESKIGTQGLAWALVFALTLSVIPYSSADGETEEWFEDWYYDFEDRDEDDNSDLITIHEELFSLKLNFLKMKLLTI